MTDAEIIDALRAEAGRCTAVQLAELLGKSLSGKLTEGAIVTYFKRAFPSVPLRVLRDAGAWNRVSQGGLSDDDFNKLLRPWIGI